MPIAYTQIKDKYIRIWQAKVASPQHQSKDSSAIPSPGTIVQADKNGIDVITGGGDILRLLKIQLPGGKPLPVGEVLNAHQLDFNLKTAFGITKCLTDSYFVRI